MKHIILSIVCAALAAGSARAADMTFKSGKTGEWIYASGDIVAKTPETLDLFLRAHPGSKWLNLHSEGGQILGALELGRVIRKYGLNTYVGGLYTKGVIAAENLRRTDECYSACVWAFAGGVIRVFDGQGGILGVHQMHGEKRIGEENSQSVTQYVIAMLGQYLDEMGVAREPLDLSLLTGPETVQPITIMLAKRWRLATDHVIQSATTQMTSAPTTTPTSKGDWVVVGHGRDQSDFYYDKHSVVFRSSNDVEVIERIQKPTGFGYDIELMHYQNRADGKYFRVVGTATYSASGGLLDSSTTISDWYAVPAGSIAEEIHRLVFATGRVQ